MYIGHTRLRDVKEKNGDEYQQLTSNLSADYDGIFSNKADIVMTISIEKNIDENKHIDGTTRYMYFRSDGFVDAGGRFNQMPERVEYGAENYIEAFEQGVKGAMTGKVSDKEIQKRKAEEVANRKEKAAEYAKAEKESGIDSDKNEELKNFIQSKYSDLDDDQKKEFKKLMKENNVSSFKDVSEIPTGNLQSLADFLSA